MRKRLIAGLLIVIGTLQAVGDTLGSTVIKGLGAATSASPAAKVFTAHEGFETFSSRFFIETYGSEGPLVSLELTPSSYRSLLGPYNRRNVYGAAVSYAPVLASSPATRPMLDSVVSYAFCEPGQVFAELPVGRPGPGEWTVVRLEPRDAASREAGLPLILEVDCHE